uniref:(northern house mosquito) hypothetical protein n=1 Tax=Culex pipiens TaxID=7175 RepID=A0A8D8JY43_CULPI
MTLMVMAFHAAIFIRNFVIFSWQSPIYRAAPPFLVNRRSPCQQLVRVGELEDAPLLEAVLHRESTRIHRANADLAGISLNGIPLTLVERFVPHEAGSEIVPTVSTHRPVRAALTTPVLTHAVDSGRGEELHTVDDGNAEAGRVVEARTKEDCTTSSSFFTGNLFTNVVHFSVDITLVRFTIG